MSKKASRGYNLVRQRANRHPGFTPLPKLSPEQKVKRRYPAAKCAQDSNGIWIVCANNGTGNVLSSSPISAQDAWAHAVPRVKL